MKLGVAPIRSLRRGAHEQREHGQPEPFRKRENLHVGAHSARIMTSPQSADDPMPRQPSWPTKTSAAASGNGHEATRSTGVLRWCRSPPSLELDRIEQGRCQLQAPDWASPATHRGGQRRPAGFAVRRRICHRELRINRGPVELENPGWELSPITHMRSEEKLAAPRRGGHVIQYSSSSLCPRTTGARRLSCHSVLRGSPPGSQGSSGRRLSCPFRGGR